MDEKTKKNDNLIVKWTLSVIFFLILAISILATYFGKIDNANEKEQILTISNQMDYYGNRVNQTICALGEAIYPIGKVLSNENIPDETVLNALTASTKIKKAVLVDAGTLRGVDQSGIAVSAPEEIRNEVKSGKTTYHSLAEGKIQAAFCIDGIQSAERILYLEYDVSNLESVFKSKFPYGKDAWAAVVDNQGKIIYCYHTMEQDFLGQDVNLYDLMESDESNKFDTVSTSISHKKSGNEVMELGGREQRVFYTATNVNNWYLLAGVPTSYLKSQISAKNHLMNEMVKRLIGAVFLFVGIVIAFLVAEKIRQNLKSKDLLQLAETDQLTGLFNKVTTENKIWDYMAQNPETHGLLFILDIDNFKKINDTMGHAFGDEVLRTIGQRIRMEFRASDIIGRAGGDEFIIYLKDLKNEEIIQREAKRVEEFFHDFKAGGYVKYSATASIGCAIFSRDGSDFETLYKAADQALYKAKQRGKNQLAFYKESE